MTVLLVCAALLSPVTTQAAPLKVVTTFTILGDFVHQIAGDNADLTILVGPDGDAHVYEPTPADLKTLSQADLVIANGLGLEPWLDKLVQSSGYQGDVVKATQSITPLTIGNTSEPDPHAWQDIANGKRYVTTIATALSRKDPEHQQEYKQNAVNYLDELTVIDNWIKREISIVPIEKRKLITSHDAFHYFATAYHVTMLAPQGINTEDGISAGAIAGIIDQMRAQHIRALFFENMTDPRLIQQLESEGNAFIGGTLYSDALSASDGPASSYVLMFRHNVRQIIAAIDKNQ